VTANAINIVMGISDLCRVTMQMPTEKAAAQMSRLSIPWNRIDIAIRTSVGAA